MHPFDYVKNESLVRMRLGGTSPLRQRYEIEFPSACPAGFTEGNTVYADYYAPRDTRAPLLILSHGYGDLSLAPCLSLARLLARDGIAVIVLYLPFHTRRLPPDYRAESAMADSRTWFEFNRKAVVEIQQVVDWAYTRPEIVRERIGVAGISLGGMVSAIAMAVDPRIKAGIFITIGGNLEEVSWGGRMGGKQLGHSCTREECHAAYAQYPDYMRKVAEKGVANVAPAKECFLTDPLTYSGYLRERPILMINGKDDEIVSEQATLTLWEGCGKPRLIWAAGSHAGTYCQSTLISTEIIKFLGSIQGR
jgi:predicted esterase